MKILVFYRPNSEYSRGVEEFLHDLQRQHDIAEDSMRTIDVDSREGIALASMYDIMSTTAIIVTDNLGGFIKSWVGTELPLMGEVVAYARA